ncbi:KamA family radical SAM protein [bacterium]|nr:KamA family radical SAM protein [bacterium]
MESWQLQLRRSLTEVKDLPDHFNMSVEDLFGVTQVFSMKITPYYLSLIQTVGDPLFKQVVPDCRELENHGLYTDPLSEDRDSPVANIVHRYPDRCLFLISAECASYCRFCTRKRKVGDSKKINRNLIHEGIRYIRDHSEIRDVILSGGDPLILSDQRLESILREIRAIPHVEIIRIGSRVPCFLPHRITPEMTQMLRKYHPLYMNVHFNHPAELTPLAIEALGRLADAGIPLGNQTVLLKGVNDNPQVMRLLMQKLLMARVRPYYIYQADMVFGTEHFRTTIRKGLDIVRALRGWTSGLAVPHYVIDAPGGGGKIPLLPEYVKKITDDSVVLRNYRGKTYVYKQTGDVSQHQLLNEDACFLKREQ